MPEAPEVQELAEFLTRRARGREIRSADIALGKILKTPDAPLAGLVGARIVGVQRFAKMIDVVAADPAGALAHMVVHFGHDGWVVWHDVVPDDMKRAGEATLMARVRLDDGAGFDLTDAGQWKALTVHVVADPFEVPAIAKLGPDPVDPALTFDTFAGILRGRKKQIKALLQDQTALAGIGNAYSDEILHAAKIGPLVHASTLTAEQVAALYEATRNTLTDAIAARRGVPPADLKAVKHAAMRVHGRAGEACPVCGDAVREITVSGATAQYCATCQAGSGG